MGQMLKFLARKTWLMKLIKSIKKYGRYYPQMKTIKIKVQLTPEQIQKYNQFREELTQYLEVLDSRGG